MEWDIEIFQVDSFDWMSLRIDTVYPIALKMRIQYQGIADLRHYSVPDLDHTATVLFLVPYRPRRNQQRAFSCTYRSIWEIAR